MLLLGKGCRGIQRDKQTISVVPSMEDLKTFKGKIFWKLVYPVKVNVDGVVHELNYYVDIDAISGNILEIVHDVY